MNKIFKVIWNHATQSWVATSELSRTKGKSKTKSVALAVVAAGMGLCAAEGALAAMAVGGPAVGGSGMVTTGNQVNTLTVGNTVVAAGTATVSDQNRGMAIGENASVSYPNAPSDNAGVIRNAGSIAIGNNASVLNTQKGIAFGTDAKVIQSNAVVIGTNATAAQILSDANNNRGLVVIGTDALIRNVANGQVRGSTAIGANSLTGFLTAQGATDGAAISLNDAE